MTAYDGQLVRQLTERSPTTTTGTPGQQAKPAGGFTVEFKSGVAADMEA